MSLLKVGHEIVRSETRGNKRKLVASKEGKEETGEFFNKFNNKSCETALTGQKRTRENKRKLVASKEGKEENGRTFLKPSQKTWAKKKNGWKS